LKIFLLQDHLRSGGAARAASRWASLLKGSGHTVIQVAGDERSVSGFLLTGKPPRGWGRVRELFLGRGQRKKKVSHAWLDLLRTEKPDLVWAHNLAGGEKWGWNLEMMNLARETCPVLWTLHDMWGLGDSDKSFWEVGPVVESRRGQGTALQGSRVERVCRAEAKFPIRLTAPSRWLSEVALKTTGQRCDHWPNPVDFKAFSPGEQAEARRALGLPKTGALVLAGADSLHDPRKGMDLLAGAWREARLSGARLVLFGRGKPEIPGAICLGSLETDQAMANAYRAADLYVHPARMENAPCTIQEAMACGTPVLAFAVGGIPEMIEADRTGFLCESVTVAALGKALREALTNSVRLTEVREACRRVGDMSELMGRFEKLLHEIRRFP